MNLRQEGRTKTSQWLTIVFSENAPFSHYQKLLWGINQKGTEKNDGSMGWNACGRTRCVLPCLVGCLFQPQPLLTRCNSSLKLWHSTQQSLVNGTVGGTPGWETLLWTGLLLHTWALAVLELSLPPSTFYQTIKYCFLTYHTQPHRILTPFVLVCSLELCNWTVSILKGVQLFFLVIGKEGDGL